MKMDLKGGGLLYASAILTIQVPRLDPGGVAAPAAINPPRAQGLGPEAFGAGLGEGLQRVSRTGFEILKEEKDKVDRTAAIESRTRLDQTEVDLLYHPEKGALAKRGKDAFSIEEPTLADFDKRVGEIETGLTSPEQKDAFRLLAAQRRVEVDKQIQRHVSGEMKTYADEANKASLESTLTNVTRHYQDPDRVEAERKFGLAVIMSDTANKGLPPQVVKMKADAWDSMVHKSVIEQMMVGNPVGAKEYFDKIQGRSSAFDNPSGLVERGNIDLSARPQVKNADGSTSTVRSIGVNIDGKEVLIPTVSDDGRILSNDEAVKQYRETGKHLGMFKTPEDSDRYAKALHDQQEFLYLRGGKPGLLPADAAKLETTLKPLAAAQEGLDAANRIFYSAGEKATLADMLKTVHDSYPKNSEVVKHAETEIKTLYTAREAAQKQVVEDAENAVYSAVVKVKLAGGVPKRSDVPAEAWAQLAKVAPDKVDKIATEILHGQEHATDRKRQEEDRAQAKKDRAETRATVESMTTWGLLKVNPEALRTVNLDKLLASGKITKQHYQDLITDQLAIKQGKGEHEAKILSDKAAVDSVLASVKITDKKDPEKYMKFYDALNTRMKVFESENGKKPKQEDVLKLTRGLLSEVSQDVNFWPIDKTVHSFEADPTKIRVPTADRAAIVKALQTNKRPVTEDSIRNLYLERQKRNGGAK